MPLTTAPPGAHVVTLEIDGHHLSARDDESIIEVCRENGIEKPPMVKSFKATGLTPV